MVSISQLICMAWCDRCFPKDLFAKNGDLKDYFKLTAYISFINLSKDDKEPEYELYWKSRGLILPVQEDLTAFRREDGTDVVQ